MKFLLCALLLVACATPPDSNPELAPACGPGQSCPVQQALHGSHGYGPPWGNDVAVTAYFGRVTSHDSKHWLLWKRKGTTQCSWVEVGPAAQLGQDVTVGGTTGNDDDLLVAGDADLALTASCNGGTYTFTAPVLVYQLPGGATAYDRVTINGGAAQDYLRCVTVCTANGMAGNDLIKAYGGLATAPWQQVLDAGDDNDKVFTYATDNVGTVTGGAGNDCLWRESGTAATTYSGGPGSDFCRYSVDCEAEENNGCAYYPW